MTDQQRQALTELRDWMEKWDATITANEYNDIEVNILVSSTSYNRITFSHYIEELYIDKILKEEDE